MKFASHSILSAAIALACSVDTHAMPYCSEPSQPPCLIFGGKFDSKLDFEMCKLAVETYRQTVESYLECLDRAKASAVEEFKATVRKFNCKARGEIACF